MIAPAASSKVAVVGLGLLGRGIVARFLACGFHVVAVDRSEEQQVAARREIAVMLEELILAGHFPASLREEWSSRYVAATGFDGLTDCAFVVESVTEAFAAKDAVITALESIVGAGTVIASNTSSIPISQLQRGRHHPRRFVGMHWAEPAHATRFMELIRGEETSDEAFATAADFARRLGKEPSLCQKDVPGFIVNRIGYAMYREALHLFESGVADVETIDTAVRNALGLWATVCGPFRWMDLTGGPEVYTAALNRVLPTLSNANEASPTMQKLAAEGARGVANGRGFHHYTPEEAEHWRELYRKHVWRVAQLHDEYFPLQTNPS